MPCTMPAMPCNCPLPPSPRFTSPPSHNSKVLSGAWWHAARLSIATMAITGMMCLGLIKDGRALQAAGNELKIVDRPIKFDQERIQLTIAYRRIHQDPKISDVIIQPKMIILHWTNVNSFTSAWNYFNRTRAEADRTQLAAAGEVNVSAQFLVDRDGTIYRLMPENWMARHCIGLHPGGTGGGDGGGRGKI